METKRVIFNAVESSNIEGIAYDTVKGRLYVAFLSGKVYSYDNVDKEQFNGALEAKSVGTFLQSIFKEKDKYPYRGEKLGVKESLGEEGFVYEIESQ